MRSKNSARITPAESAHMLAVKLERCSICGGEGGYAHHIEQGLHFCTVAVCWHCHQGPNGIHGDKTMLRIYKTSELQALNRTLQWIATTRGSHEPK
jgi:hypothetical protein